MDNRNMCLPFLIGYGIAMVLVYIILGTPNNLWLFGKTIKIQSRSLRVLVYFLGVMLCICIGEIALGTFVEKICHFYWWDYTKLPMHITRYTSIPTSVLFSIIVTFFMDKCFYPMYNYFARCNTKKINYVAVALMSLMLGDFIYNGYKMYKTCGMVRRWRLEIGNSRLYRNQKA